MSRTYRRSPDQDFHDQIARASVRRQARRLAELAWGPDAAIANLRSGAWNSRAHALEAGDVFGHKQGYWTPS